MTSNAAGLSVMVRCRRTHRLCTWRSGRAWAIGGGATFVVSAKSGIWGGVDADITAEAVPNTERQTQATIVHERKKENRCPAPFAGDCGIGAVGSIQPSLCPPVCNTSGESKGDAFPWNSIPGAKGLDLLQYQAILRLTKNSLQMTGREPLQQGLKVEGMTYAETGWMIDRLCKDGAGRAVLHNRSWVPVRTMPTHLPLYRPRFSCTQPL